MQCKKTRSSLLILLLKYLCVIGNLSRGLLSVLYITDVMPCPHFTDLFYFQKILQYFAVS